jgi:hypothetical protein
MADENITTVKDVVVRILAEAAVSDLGLETPVVGYYKGESSPFESIVLAKDQDPDNDYQDVPGSEKIYVTVRS